MESMVATFAQDNGNTTLKNMVENVICGVRHCVQLRFLVNLEL